MNEASHGAKSGCEFDSHSKEMKYLIFSFSRFGNEAKRGVEFLKNSMEDGKPKCFNGSEGC